MKLSEISIRRPVLAIMMNLALVLFGLVALQRLPVRELPDIDPPIVNVMTIYPGANPEVVETEVTEKLEEAINSVEGIKTLSSESREQLSSITVEFDLSRPIELAAQDVRDRVSRVRGELPADIEEPVISKQDADAQPVIWIALFSDRHTTLELTTIAENLMKDRLQTVKGVSSIFLGGQKRFAMRLRLDASKMAAHQVTVLDIEQALQSQNVELPSGRIENLEREMTIKTRGELKTAEEFNQLVIKKEGDAFVRLRDIGFAEVGVEDERSIARFNSKPAVGLGIVKQAKANTIEVAKGIKAELNNLLPLLPPGIEARLPYDESIYVEHSIKEVWKTLAIAFVLVCITIFVFLRNVRSTLIPCLTVPVSIIATFMVLSIMGYSINILTMLALVLAIGIVVDDSIVVLENIYRHMEDGMTPMDAAYQGMREIGFAIVAITLSLIAVFIPLAFQATITGRLFIEFAFALCGSVVISAFIALTLTPMVSARILKPVDTASHGRIFNFFEHYFERLSNRYERALRWTLDHTVAMAFIGLAIIGLTVFFYLRLEKEFLPEEDKGRLLCFALTPEGSTSEYTDRMVQKMESFAGATPEIEGYFSAVALPYNGPGKGNEGLMFMRLKEERKQSVGDLVNGPNGLGAKFFMNIEGALAFPIIPKAIDRGFGQPFQLLLLGQNIEDLNRAANDVANELRGAGFLMNVRNAFEMNKPELRVQIDRDRATALGVSIRDLSRTMQILFGGLDLSKIKVGSKEYDVVVQLDRSSRLTPSDLERLYIRNDKGTLIQLNNIIRYETSAGPNAIYHHNRFRSAMIEGTPMGMPLGTVAERVEEMLKGKLPDGIHYTWAGEAEDLQEAGRGFMFIVVLGIIIVYMVLASQFESLLHPLTIMLTLPLAAVGAFGSLWLLQLVNQLGTMLYGWSHFAPDAPAAIKWLSTIVPRIPAMNINLFTQIGLVLLLGLVTKNSILLVEFANQQREKGKSAKDAIIDAGLIRFRPILMTSFSTILGILPIAIGFGEGAESRRPMGVAAVGGLLSSTLLTLLVIPVVYLMFSKWSSAKRKSTNHATTALSLFIIASLFFVGTSTEAAEKKSKQTYTLDQCLAVALENNYDILQAREQIQKQEGVVVEVRAASIPQLNANGQYEKIDENRVQNFGSDVSNNESWYLELEASQSLYSGGRNLAGLQRQQFLKTAAIHEMENVVNNTLLQVREKYYGVLLSRSQIDVQEENIKLLKEELQYAQNKFETGAVPSFNVLRAEVALANGQPPLIRARNNYRLALDELAHVMGVSFNGQHGIDVEGKLKFKAENIALERVLQTALQERPELKQIQSVIEAGKKAIKESRAGYKPELEAYAAYGAQNDQFSDDIADELHGWKAGLRLSWGIFDGMLSHGRVIQAASDLEIAKLDESETRLNIELEVRQAYSLYLEAKELVSASRKVVEQAKESLRLARSRYDAGAATQLDVLDSQVALTDARSNEIQALHDYNVALARLRKAMATDLERKEKT